MKKRHFFLIAAAFAGIATAQTPAPPAAPASPPAANAAADKDKPAPAPAEPEPIQYIRVEKIPGGEVQLQTALVHLKKGDATLDLVGAVHIADSSFYQGLNKRFESYDALLFEAIGNPNPHPAPDRPVPKPVIPETGTPADAAAPKKKTGNLSGLHDAYIAGAKYLDLAFQMDEVDYRKPNFVHADVTMEEFNDLQAQRKESLLGFAFKAGFANALSKQKAPEPNSFKLLYSAIKGDKNGLKRELVGTLGAGDDQVSQLAGDNVIITDRNAKCLKVLDEQIAAGKKNLGIFYGAAHFPDMEKRLLAAGWERTGSDWLVAWSIAK